MLIFQFYRSRVFFIFLRRSKLLWKKVLDQTKKNVNSKCNQSPSNHFWEVKWEVMVLIAFCVDWWLTSKRTISIIVLYSVHKTHSFSFSTNLCQNFNRYWTDSDADRFLSFSDQQKRWRHPFFKISCESSSIPEQVSTPIQKSSSETEPVLFGSIYRKIYPVPQPMLLSDPQDRVKSSRNKIFDSARNLKI